jgi:hypothetical protein
MIDLRQAIKVRKMLPKDRRYKIGICKKFPGDFPARREGEVVLFRVTSGNICTIETPINNEWIAKNIAEGNGLRTINTMIAVPLSLIEEVLL